MEYTMIVALIGMGLVVVLSVLGGTVRNSYQRTSATVSRQTVGAGGGGGSGPVSTSLHPTPVSPSDPPDSTGAGGSSDSAATNASSY